MKICGNCNFENADGNLYCQRCGVLLNETPNTNNIQSPAPAPIAPQQPYPQQPSMQQQTLPQQPSMPMQPIPVAASPKKKVNPMYLVVSAVSIAACLYWKLIDLGTFSIIAEMIVVGILSTIGLVRSNESYDPLCKKLSIIGIAATVLFIPVMLLTR